MSASSFTKDVADALQECTDSIDVAEPFRFNFEVAWEVAHKGELVFAII